MKYRKHWSWHRTSDDLIAEKIQSFTDAGWEVGPITSLGYGDNKWWVHVLFYKIVETPEHPRDSQKP
jgi:hypothetical protein